MSRRRAAVELSLIGLLLWSGCNADPSETVLLVDVTLAANVGSPIKTLRVTVTAGSQSDTNDFPGRGGQPISFPTSFTAQLPRTIAGPIDVEIRGLDATGTVVANGTKSGVAISVGKSQSVDVVLGCVAATCAGDAGTDGAADGGVDGSTGAPDGAADGAADGACSIPSCDDGLACTKDIKSGDGCNVECSHTEISTLTPGDGCCPANGTHTVDPDCSATCGNGSIEAGETCDTAIARGTVGACPLAADCVDGDACTMNSLLSANTCSARCLAAPITTRASGDGCCPPGANYNTDTDCPVVCGNGVVEKGETCDTGIAPPATGACPTACDDMQPCTDDTLSGSGCTAACPFRPIVAFMPGDGCCPTGGNRNVDDDCPAVCGNGVLEMGEACDRGIGAGSGACPGSCPDDGSACTKEVLRGDAASCTARCTNDPVTVCGGTPDLCCPSGCDYMSDSDCSASCGNGTVEPPETCDTGIAPGAAGACPQTCSDGLACTRDDLQSAGTCSATCRFPAITDFVGGDGCCPTGGNHNLDADCPVVCGNGIVEGPSENCDKAIAAGAAGACPTSCPPASGCTTFGLTGSSADCSARCDPSAITTCASGDACCPSTCNKVSDGDCAAVCGNGVHEPGEACDKGITAGNPGACLASCDDLNACTSDSTSGNVSDCTRSCSSAPIAACAAGDMCCPSGCNSSNDGDCSAMCGNGVVEAGESCDPPSTCPATCPDDGDSCTTDTIIGAQNMCTAVCTHPPITTCSGTASDLCCPTSCNANTDSDCVPDCGNGVTEAGEECDDANGNDSDDCLATCKRAHCGDGVTHSSGTGPFEQCDDANSSNADDCVAGCKNHACGDGYRHTTGRLPIEECDDGNLSGGDACSGDCRNVEFPVATTGAAQIRPVAAVGSGGDVFIGWLDISGAYPVARGRLFASNGVPKGGEILLHAFTATGANGIDATADGSGSKLLVALDAGAPTVRARVLDFGGTFLDGGAITVKSYPNGEVSAPRATWVPGGDFFVAWRRTGALALNTSLEGAAVSMSGAAASFTLADPTLQNVAGTDVTPLMTNQIYAVWAQSGADIIGATFDVPLAAGGSPAMVNLVTAGNQNAVAAATNELGQRFVLWSDASGARDPDCGSSSCGIEARLLCPPPCAITELTVNSLTSKEQKVGDVGYGRGRFVTVFESAARGTAVAKDCIPSADCDVAMRLFNGTAPAVNPFSGSSEDMWVNQDTTAPKQRPRVAVGPEGTVVVVWESYAGGSSTIAARIFERLLP